MRSDGSVNYAVCNILEQVKMRIFIARTPGSFLQVKGVITDYKVYVYDNATYDSFFRTTTCRIWTRSKSGAPLCVPDLDLEIELGGLIEINEEDDLLLTLKG